MVDESGARRLLAELERHADGLLVNFTGREWLVERVRAWQADPRAKPFLLIQGAAGIGKSAFAAHLWRTQKMVTAVHFCIAGRGGTTEPLTFVEVLSAQLAAELPGFTEARRRVIDAYARQTVQIQSEVQAGEVHPGGRVTGVAVQFRLESIPPEQAFDLLIRRPLREVAAAGGLSPVLLLVDALDEALTHHTLPTILHLLQKSGDLPPQVRWVLTSRPEPQVTQALADLPVEILDAADPRHQADVQQYLRARVSELEQTVRAWGMDGDALVEYLGQRSEWNFLYLTSIWPDLAEGRIPSPESLPVGLDGYYRYLLDTRVGAEDWQKWGADLMEVLLALQEPVDPETLASFLGWEPRRTHQRVLRVAQVLSPALLQEGRYFRHHWSLAEFLRDRARAGPWWCDLTGKHRQIAESILSGWGGLEAGLPGLHSIEEANYGTRHLVAHLIEGGQYEQAARLLRLEREEEPHPVHAWHAVHERLGTPQDFERDLRRAWEAASAINREAARQGQVCPRLGDEIRYALIEASLHSLAGNLPPKLLAALVEYRIWDPMGALAYARQIPYDSVRAEALAFLSPQLAKLGYPKDALTIALKIEDEEYRAQALAELAPHLPENLLQAALDATREIGNFSHKDRARGRLARRLAELGHPEEALTVVRGIYWDYAQILADLAPYLPETLRQEALAESRKIWLRSDCAEALDNLARYLPENLLREAIGDAMKVDDSQSILAVASLASRLAELGYPQEAIDLARKFRGERDCARILASIIPYLPNRFLWEIWTTIREVKDEYAQSFVLARLAPRMAEMGHPKEALAITRQVEVDWYRARVLVGLAPRLPRNLLKEALAIAQEIRSEEDCAYAYIGLAPYLPKTLLWSTLSFAEKLTYNSQFVRDLGNLVPYLPKGFLWKIIDRLPLPRGRIRDTLNTARRRWHALFTIESGWVIQAFSPLLDLQELFWRIASGRCQKCDLISLIPNMPQYLRQQVLQEAIDTCREIKDKDSRVQALITLAPHLPEDLRKQALHDILVTPEGTFKYRRTEILAGIALRLAELGHYQEALAVTRKIKRKSDRAEALAALVPHLPQDLQEQTLKEALGAARRLCVLLEADSRVRVLSRLAPYLSQGLLQDALKSAQKIPVWCDARARADALGGLAPYLPPDLQKKTLHEALAIVREISEEYVRASVLAHLASHLTDDLLQEALVVAREIRNEDDRAQALAGLAPHLPEDLRKQVLQEILSTARETPEYQQAEILSRLALQMAELGHYEEALAAARGIGWESDCAEALARLVPRLPEELLREALSAAREMVDESARAKALAVLAHRLPEDLREQVLREALTVARKIKWKGERAEALTELTPHLLGDLREKVLQEALDAAKVLPVSARAKALVGLAPHLPPDLQKWALREALASARESEDESARALALGGLGLQLAELGRYEEAMSAVREIRDESARAEALVGIVPHLATLPSPALYPLWAETLPVLARRTRKDLLSDICALEPVIYALGGEAAIVETFHAIQDVGRWWP